MEGSKATLGLSSTGLAQCSRNLALYEMTRPGTTAFKNQHKFANNTGALLYILNRLILNERQETITKDLGQTTGLPAHAVAAQRAPPNTPNHPPQRPMADTAIAVSVLQRSL